MSTPQGRKPKSESYAYSWFLPAEGHNGSAIVTQLPPSELEAVAQGPEISQAAAMKARTEAWRRSGATRPKAAHKSSAFSLVSLRLAGIGGWSIIAGSGAALLASRAGPFPGLQLGVLAGVWLGVSVAIWFVPGILSRPKAPSSQKAVK